MILLFLACHGDDPKDTGTNDGFTPTFVAGDCPLEVSDDVPVTCGTVEVPARWDDLTGPTLSLQALVIPATGDAPSDVPLFMLTGGAGASAILSFSALMTGTEGRSLRQDKDIVLFDQRGTYYSAPALLCPEYVAVAQGAFGTTLDINDLGPADLAAMADCYDRLSADGIDLGAFNSVENAADVPAVAAALGYDSYDVYAVSYGTIRTQHLLRDHPEGVRSVVLDSVAPLESGLFTLAPANADRALRLIFSSCAADPSCAAAWPDLETTFLNLVLALDLAPVPIQVNHPTDGSVATVPLTGQALTQIVMGNINASALPYLPIAIGLAAEGDYSLISTVAGYAIYRDDTFSDGMETAFRCTEGAVFDMTDVNFDGLYEPVTSFMQPFLQNILDTCTSAWPLPANAADTFLAVNSEVPALLMAGAFDITTPPELAEQLASHLPNSEVLTFNAHGHVVLGECALDLMAQFYADPSAALDATCVEEDQLHFVVP